MMIQSLHLVKSNIRIKLQQSDNIYYNFALAAFKEIAMAGDDIDACLPEEWRPFRPVVAVGDETGPASFVQLQARKSVVQGADDALGQIQKALNPILPYLGVAVDAACGGRAALQSFVIGLIADQLKNIVPIPPELQALLLVETESRSLKVHKTHKNKKWGFSLPAINIPNPAAIAEAARKAAEQAANAARQAAEQAAAQAKQAAEQAARVAKEAAERAAKEAEAIAKKALEVIMSGVKPIVDKIPEMLAKITNFINSPMVTGILKIMNCILKGVQAIREVINVIKGFKAKLQLISTGPPGLVNIAVAFICNWREFKESIDFITKGVNEQETLAKWQWFGRFFGKFVHAIGTA